MKLVLVALAVLPLSRLTASEDPNQPPVVRVGWTQQAPLYVGEELRFRVRASDPEGDPITLRLETLPPGVVFPPAVAAVGPVERELRWRVPAASGGVRRLAFEAFDPAHPQRRTRRVVAVRVSGGGLDSHSGLQIGDVTGDGRPDVVATARKADADAATDVGAAYVWSGAISPSGAPTATLAVPGAHPRDELGEVSGNGASLVDLNGDGVLDLVLGAMNADSSTALDAGAVYVWFGGSALRGERAPDATLVAPSSAPSLRLGGAWWGGQGLQFEDVTGDGLVDLVVTSPETPIGGVSQAGAIYVFAGGDLSGRVEASAVLVVAGATSGQVLGGGGGQGVQLFDLTADGVPDVVAATPYADVNGVTNAGAIFVWAGGSGLTGRPLPSATLSVPTAVDDDQLGGGPDARQLVRFGDVTGDGLADLVAGAPYGGQKDKGRVYVFEGGPGLSGDVAPRATMKVPGAQADDRLPWGSGHVLRLEDVTGDGYRDVVAGTTWADAGSTKNAGAIYVFAGGPAASGERKPTATLVEPLPVKNSRVGDYELGDVTGDGVLDVLSVSPWAAAAAGGAVRVWKGGPMLTATRPPDASLTGATALHWTGRSFQLDDVDGDGVLDVLAGDGGFAPPGGLPVWKGGLMNGPVTPTTFLFSPTSGTQTTKLGQSVFVADVTGDGRDDVLMVVVPSPTFVGGAVVVWEGQPLLSAVGPPIVLHVAGALNGDRLGSASGQPLQLADFDADGVLDVVVSSYEAGRGVVDDVGAVYGWRVVAGAGTLTESWALQVHEGSANDRLGLVAGHGVWLGDLDGDRHMDVLAGGSSVDVDGVQDVGACYLWSGVPGSPAPARLAVPGAEPRDLLAN